MYDWESEFKTKEKSIWTKEKIAPQHLFPVFLSNFKGRNNSIQSAPVFFFFEDDEIISWLPSVKASHKASRFSYFQLFALCRASLEALAEEAVSALS